jgi:hypothetical protein
MKLRKNDKKGRKKIRKQPEALIGPAGGKLR